MKKSASPVPVLLIVSAGLILTGLVLHSLGFFSGDRNDEQVLFVDGSPTGSSGRPIIDDDEPGFDVEPESSRPVAVSDDGNRESVPQRPFQGVRGYVRDGLTGERVQAFSVHIFGSDEIDIESRVTVDPGKIFRNTNGQLMLRDLDEGSYRLFIKSTGYQDPADQDTRVPQKTAHLDFKLQRGTHITGRIIDAEGNAVADMPVFIKCVPRNPGTPPPPRRTAVTDRNGRFLFGNLVEGTYDVLLESLTEPLDSVTDVFLTEGQAFSREFTVPLFNELDFLLSAPNGKPLNNVSIRFFSETRTFNAKTQHDGKASLKRVPPGNYEIVLAKSRFKTHRETINIITLTGKMVVERILEYEM
jgi:hypothetical protein